jgi:Mg2+/Co2+ transporter CorC
VVLVVMMDPAKTFRQLHRFHQPILIDEEGAMAFLIFLGDQLKNSTFDKDIHSAYLKKAKASVKSIYPDLST